MDTDLSFDETSQSMSDNVVVPMGSMNLDETSQQGEKDDSERKDESEENKPQEEQKESILEIGASGETPPPDPTVDGNGSADVSSEFDEDAPLERSYLGDAIDSLMMHWCQFLTNVSVRPPVPPPSTLDHVKEVAEVGSKHFRDACVDVGNEFYRIGVQWEFEEFEENFAAEERDLDAAIGRQNELLAKVKESLKKRADDYNFAYPQAGHQYTT